MIFYSPTFGRLDFKGMFNNLINFVTEMPEFKYNLIVGTDSLLGEDILFVTAIIVHRVGKGGRYYYRKFRFHKFLNLHQRLLYETSLSLEMASQLTREFSLNEHSSLPVEIHVDVGENGESRKIIREVVGMVTGSGFPAVIKPYAYGASKVADRHSK